MAYQKVKLINDEFRTARMNECYYAQRLTTMTSRWRWVEILIAVTASGTVASWAIWSQGQGTLVWQILSGIVAVLAVVRSVVNPATEIDRLADLRSKYVNVRCDLGTLVRELAADRSLTDAQWKRFLMIMDRCKELQLKDDPSPDRKLLRECQNDVRREWPASRFWWPPKTQPAPGGGGV